MAVKIDVLIDIKSVQTQLKQIESMGSKIKIRTDDQALQGLTNGVKMANQEIKTMSQSILEIPMKFAKWYAISAWNNRKRCQYVKCKRKVLK